ncbi:MAG: hypothetical protein ABIY50_07445 [Ignavibacteria bacterium]
MKNVVTGISKMKRGNFFKYAGGALLGIITFANIPFRFFQPETSTKKASLKITENPNAVKRSTGAAKNA